MTFGTSNTKKPPHQNVLNAKGFSMSDQYNSNDKTIRIEMLKPFNIFLFYFLSLLTPWVHSPNLSSVAISFTLTFDLPTDLASNLVVDLSFDLIVTSFWSLLWSHCCIPPISLSDATFDKFFLIYFYGIPYNFFFGL